MKLTIITINRNNAIGLRKTIESVQMQVFTDYEYIVVDGASTDDSIEIIKQYSDSISYWISEPDNGIYNAMNKGILMASGEYVQFLNSGDCFVDEYVLQKVINYLQCDIVYGDLIYVNGDVKLRYMSLYNTKEPSLMDFYDGFFLHPSSFIRKNIFDKVGLYDETLSIVADWKWFLQAIVLENVEIRYCNVNVVLFDSNGISSRSSCLEIEERKKVLADIIPHRILVDYNEWNKTVRQIQKIQGERKLNFLYKILIWLSKRI